MSNGVNKIIFSVALVVLAGMAVAVFSLAAETDTVTGTVTVQTLFSAGTGITAQNDGSVADFDIYGADTGDWTLNTATSTTDNYTHKFCNETDNDCAASGVYGANFTALTTSPATLDASVANAGTVDFQLSMHTPNPSSVYTQQSAVVTVQASAP